MSEIGAVRARREYAADEETTSGIVQRDTHIHAELHGDELSWKQTKQHQQSLWENKGALIAEGLTTAFEGAEISGAITTLEHGVVALGVAQKTVDKAILVLGLAAPAAALGLGAYELVEAHANGDEQKEAVARDQARVALIGALDLPQSYAARRLNGDLASVPKGPHDIAFKATEALVADRKGLALLQLHADRGMAAARDLAVSGMTKEDFLKAHPHFASKHKDDAAFFEGFEAYSGASPAERKVLDAKLADRNGWSAQSEVRVRI